MADPRVRFALDDTLLLLLLDVGWSVARRVGIVAGFVLWLIALDRATARLLATGKTFGQRARPGRARAPDSTFVG